MKGLQVFENQEFGAIRTLEENGMPLFCGSDVARALGYIKPQNAVAAHCKGALKRGTPTQSGEQTMLFIPEGDVYRLITHSKLPAAERFEKWVFDEVLPAIRKHGVFATESVLDDPDVWIAALKELKAERQRRTTLEAQSAQQQRELVEIRPKAAYYDLILQNPNTITVTQIAKDYGMSAVMFNRLLERLGLQYRQGGAWQLYQKYASRGYTQSRTEQVSEEHAVTYTCWTQAGRRFLYDFLKENANGMLPMIEREAAI